MTWPNFQLNRRVETCYIHILSRCDCFVLAFYKTVHFAFTLYRRCRDHISTNVTILISLQQSSNSLQNDQQELWCFEIKQCAIAFLPSHLNGRQNVSVSWLSYTGKVWRNDGRVKSYMKWRMASVHFGYLSCAVPVFYKDTWWLRSIPVKERVYG